MSFYERNRSLDDLVNQEEKKRRKNQAKSNAESSFYEKPTNSGIMKPQKPKFGSIQQIKDAQEEQKKRVAEAHEQEWAGLSTGTDEVKKMNRQNRKAAEQGLKDLDLELTAAYGLGDNGYWSKNNKSYGQTKQVQNKQLDDMVHDYGRQTMPKSPSVKPKTLNDTVTRSIPQKPMIVDTKSSGYGIKPKQDIAKGVQRLKEQQIAQKQDEIVHGQNLGQTTKWKLDDELQKLKAEKEVILWKSNHSQPPTSEAYDTKKRYYNDQIAKASDDYLNEYGGKDSEETKTAWADYQNKVSDLVSQRDAFNRAKMGVDNEFVQGTQYFGSEDVPLDSENELDEVVNPSVLRSHELIEIIGQYYMDKANSNMDIKDFLGKYPWFTADDYVEERTYRINWGRRD